MTSAPVLTSLRRSLARPVPARVGVAGLVVLALTVYGLSSVDHSLATAPAPLMLLAIPLALASIVYGIRGGVGFGLLAAALCCLWWLRHGEPDGVSWAVSRSAVTLLLGSLLGWSAETRQALSREVSHHRELSLDLIATASFDGFFVEVNPAFTRVLGFSRDELLASPIRAFVHPDDRDRTDTAVREQIEGGVDVLGFQNRLRTKGGDHRWFEWTSRPDPQARILIGVGRDITDRKILEEHERRHQENLERAVADRTEELEEARRETVSRLALVAEYRDDDLREHPARVGETAALIAARMGLPEQEVRLIREAALLHDVGKVAIPDAVLLKPEALTEAEFEHLKRHAGIGAAILSGSTSQLLRRAEDIARAHHEWWDGSGYPLGLRREEIPLAARIVAVADVFDAITHARPYKPARPIVEAVSEICGLSGTQFDPAVVDAFVALDTNEMAPLPHTGATEPELDDDPLAGPRRLGQIAPTQRTVSPGRRGFVEPAGVGSSPPSRARDGARGNR